MVDHSLLRLKIKHGGLPKVLQKAWTATVFLLHDGTVNGNVYIKQAGEHIEIPQIGQYSSTNVIFQQDGAPSPL